MENSEMPKISVIMPVYNGEKFLAQAIESILTQTMADFEFIIICEFGTNQQSLSIVEKYAEEDSRITVLRNDVKRGLPITLNIGLKAAHGDYIVRMDGDDIALTNRLAKQVEFMELNPDVAIAGSKVVYIDEEGIEFYQKDNLSEDAAQIKADFLFFCFIHHPTIIMRTQSVIDYCLYYDETFTVAEDYELWCRASHIVKFAKIPEILLKYRWHQKSASHSNNELSEKSCAKIMRVNLEKLGVQGTDEEINYLCRVTCRENFADYKKVERTLEGLAGLIIQRNREIQLYDETFLINTLEKRLYWRRHRVRRLTVIALKSISMLTSNDTLFYAAIYLELNGFTTLIRRFLSSNFR